MGSTCHPVLLLLLKDIINLDHFLSEKLKSTYLSSLLLLQLLMKTVSKILGDCLHSSYLVCSGRCIYLSPILCFMGGDPLTTVNLTILTMVFQINKKNLKLGQLYRHNLELIDCLCFKFHAI